MAKWPIALAILAALSLAAAPAAYPCTSLADIDLVPAPALNPDDEDEPATPGGEPPAFPPGAVVTAHGTRFDPAAVTPITLRWGSTGPAIAQVPINEDGSWRVTFQLPLGIPDGQYVIYAEAFAADGQMIEGLPARQFLQVVTPRPNDPSPGVSPPVTPPQAETPAASPRSDARPRAKRAAAPHRHASTPKASTVAKPKTIPVAPLPPRPVAPVATSTVKPHSHASSAPAIESAPLERAHAPAPRIESAPLPPRAAPGQSPAIPVATADSSDGTPWLVFVIGALGILLLGAAGGGLVIARRWPPAPPTDPVEAELQELIAERRARAEDSVRDW